ncbi:SRPBCC domain-containing protein [Puerhibacterium puerhi]|uniref:SRPBCC domain-containing protein n=1 Tax=Puerhibacterium puerhi TaxID=2692623 RepID=UPI00135847F2|nr:SRPBCC domain-containing protein [Puerhibacterium puerhi]
MPLPTRTITAAVDLDAAPRQVWDVLADGPSHAGWNPFLTRLDGTLTVGSRLDVRIAPPGGRPMTFRPAVTAVEPGRRLAWLGRLVLPGLFDGEHSFVLDPLPGGGTRLTQRETFRGLLVPFTGSVLRRTEAGFGAMHEALRRRLAEPHAA